MFIMVSMSLEGIVSVAMIAVILFLVFAWMMVRHVIFQLRYLLLLGLLRLRFTNHLTSISLGKSLLTKRFCIGEIFFLSFHLLLDTRQWMDYYSRRICNFGQRY